MKKYLLTIFLVLTLIVAMQPHQTLAAGIAFDNKADGSNTTGLTLSWSQTTAASAIGFVGVQSDPLVDNITGVTWGGSAMTLVGKTQRGGSSRWVYLFHIENPPAGSDTITVTSSIPTYIEGGSVSYTGASLTGQPDASNTGNGNTASPTLSCTSVTDNAWAIFWGVTGGGAWVTGTYPLRLSINGGSRNSDFYDTNAVIHPAGTITFDQTITSSPTTYGAICAAFKPAGVTAVASFNPYYFWNF